MVGKAERDDKIQGWEAKYVRGDKAEGSQVRNRNKPGGDQQNQFETFDAAPERELNTGARAWTDELADALSPARSLPSTFQSIKAHLQRPSHARWNDQHLPPYHPAHLADLASPRRLPAADAHNGIVSSIHIQWQPSSHSFI